MDGLFGLEAFALQALRDASEAVVGGVFVGLGERRVVEDLLDEGVDVPAERMHIWPMCTSSVARSPMMCTPRSFRVGASKTSFTSPLVADDWPRALLPKRARPTA